VFYSDAVTAHNVMFVRLDIAVAVAVVVYIAVGKSTRPTQWRRLSAHVQDVKLGHTTSGYAHADM